MTELERRFERLYCLMVVANMLLLFILLNPPSVGKSMVERVMVNCVVFCPVLLLAIGLYAQIAQRTCCKSLPVKCCIAAVGLWTGLLACVAIDNVINGV